MTIPGSTNPLLAYKAAAATQYQVSRSLRFNSADSAYLSRTPGTAGNRKTWTWSGWVKRSSFGSRQNLFQASASTATAPLTYFEFDANNKIQIAEWTGSANNYQLLTTQVFRDPSAFLHLAVAFDSTQTTASDRIRLYVNGVQITAFDSSIYPTQNFDTSVNRNIEHSIGRDLSGSNYFSGYLAEIHFIDGQALTPSSFGETDSVTGEWIPKAYSGSYGTCGFKLNFSNNSAATAAALGADSSGNGNNWTPNNLSVTAGAGNDSLTDSPTSYGSDTGVGAEVRGNYATWNALDASSTLANGNLETSATAAYRHARCTIAMPAGKWYAEFTVGTMLNGTSTPRFGVGDNTRPLTDSDWQTGGYGIDLLTSQNGTFAGKVSKSASVTVLVTETVTSFNTGDIVGIAYDADSGKIWFSRNGTWFYSGNPATGANPIAQLNTANTLFFHVEDYSSSSTANFGQRPFAYTAPSGFKALCDTNLPAPVVAKSSDYFQTLLWTGNGASGRSITGLSFSPDLVWIKQRSNSAGWHVFFDSIRQGGQLASNVTDAELPQGSNVGGYVSAYTSNGFTMTTGSSGMTSMNASNESYVAWCWDAGSSTVTNTAGTITGGAQVRANASAGVSIVTWQAPASGSGWTVGHGLGAAPFLMIDKCRSNVGAWSVYHQSLGATKYLALNLTDAAATSSAVWNDTAPTSQVFTCGTTGWYGASFTHVTYCFAPVAGYSAFGSYTGNGSADGPFVYTGMLARWILLKRTDTTGNWTIIDTARLGYNVDNNPLYPNLADAEATTDLADILSNGFKLRTTDASVNASGGTYVYASFASSPFAYSRSR